MEYHLNFNFIWQYGSRLWWGLALSIELALVSILIGCVIGFSLAVAYTGGGRLTRFAISSYVEFIRNVPLLLLVYLVFYGIPSAGGFAYDATESFVATLSLYAGAYLVEVFRAGLDAIPKGTIDAGKAIGLTPWQRLVYIRFPHHAAHCPAVPVQRLHLAVQGHVACIGHRCSRAHLWRKLDQDQHLPRRRGLDCHGTHVSGDRLRHPVGIAAAGTRPAQGPAAMTGLWTFIVGTLPFLWSGLLMTLFVSAVVVVISAVVGALFGVGLAYGPLWLRIPLRIYSDILRGMPLLVVIFSIYYLLPFAGLNLQPLPAVLLALTMFKVAHVSEIARGAIQSIARGQIDAGKAIGLTFSQRLIYVVLPQAVRRFLPPLDQFRH